MTNVILRVTYAQTKAVRERILEFSPDLPFSKLMFALEEVFGDLLQPPRNSPGKSADEMVEEAAGVLYILAGGKISREYSKTCARAMLVGALGGFPDPAVAVTDDERELWRMETDRADAAEKQRDEWLRLADQHMEVKNEATAKVCALEARLSTIRDAHTRYQRNDLSQEEFEGTIAEIAEAEP